MVWQNIALTLAGVVGSAVAVFHGILMQRMMIRPIERALAGTPTSAGIQIGRAHV